MSERLTDQRRRVSGGYREIRPLPLTTLIYNATVQFRDRFLDKRSTMFDRLVQAAHQARQHAAEIPRTERGLTQTGQPSVTAACAALRGLLLDYEEFLRQRGLRQWPQDDPEAKAVRALAARTQASGANPSDYAIWLQSTAPGSLANCIICLVHQAISQLNEHVPPPLPSPAVSSRGSDTPIAAAPGFGTIPGAPSCPKCGQPMALRTARTGKRPGSQFWGCLGYPKCNGLRNLEP